MQVVTANEVPEVLRLVDATGQSSVVNRTDALEKAYEAELDLVCINAEVDPPVFKIMDFGKYNFDASKKQKEINKKNRQNTVKMKEHFFNLNISEHDLDIKIEHIKEHMKKYDVRVGIKNVYANRSVLRRGESFQNLVHDPDFVLKRVLERLGSDARMIASDNMIYATLKKVA